jgi:hypothetical protein
VLSDDWDREKLREKLPEACAPRPHVHVENSHGGSIHGQQCNVVLVHAGGAFGCVGHDAQKPRSLQTTTDREGL